MYGIVNQAIQGLVTENFGEEKWLEIKAKSNLDLEYFLSDQPYDDEITYKLVEVSSQVLSIDPYLVLKSFGEYWVLKTGMEKYGDLMKAGGNNFKDFIINLPNFHSRIMLIYPKLSPPEFHIEEKNDIIVLHYYSTRDGLTGFVEGLVIGLSKLFKCEIEIKHVLNEKIDSWHDIFQIRIM